MTDEKNGPSDVQVWKSARDPSRFRRPLLRFNRARDAFSALLSQLNVRDSGMILLPSYIGWSPREGSGVFDPVRASGMRYGFYAVDRHLDIDLEDLRRKLSGSDVSAILLVHYFGFPSPSASEATDLAREAGIFVVEDEAHAMLSDWVGGLCGRQGHATFYSFHKLLPVDTGGGLSFNSDVDPKLVERIEHEHSSPAESVDLSSFDFFSIARARRRNFEILSGESHSLDGMAYPLFDQMPSGVVPQTFPIVLTKANRDRVYELMNHAGYGVVSLYHTLVREVREEEFPDARFLSRKTLNLPVHQDATEEGLRNLVAYLGRILRDS